MADTKPVWLLDIDGVINACTKKPNTNVWPKQDWREGKATSNGHEWPIRWATPVIDFITTVHNSGQCEIRWHTTWQRDAQALADLTGLPEFAVANAPEYEEGAQAAAKAILDGKPVWWKLPAAERVVREEKRPLIWTDDDITWSLHRYDRMNGLHVHAPALLIAPDEQCGLTRKQLRKISDFLAIADTGIAS